MTSLSNIIVKGIFPVNNKLMFGSALYLFMPQFQFSLMKKIKIECPGHSLIPPPPPPDAFRSLIKHPPCFRNPENISCMDLILPSSPYIFQNSCVIARKLYIRIRRIKNEVNSVEILWLLLLIFSPEMINRIAVHHSSITIDDRFLSLLHYL